MYHLFVTANAIAWDGTPTVMPAVRSLRAHEYTPDDLAERYGGITEEIISQLKGFPCLFAYETDHEKDARVGWITEIKTRPGEVRIEYELDEVYPPVKYNDLQQLEWELGIASSEWRRTHWALKNEILWSALEIVGYPPNPSSTVATLPARDIENLNTMEYIPTSFLNYACGILGATSGGLSGTNLVKYCNEWAVKYNVDPPHSTYPFDAPNKRTALQENIAAFPSHIQYKILIDFCGRIGLKTPPEVKELHRLTVERFQDIYEWDADLEGSFNVEPAVDPTAKERKLTARRSPSESCFSLFLCHASADKPEVRKFYSQLKAAGHRPWLDEEDLLPGEDWDLEIKRAVKMSDVILVCLTDHSITKAGYVQKEIKMALDVADEQPEGRIFVIPVRLEECAVPDRLSKWHWVDIFSHGGFKKLLAALQKKATDT